MKVIANKCFGGFSINDRTSMKLGIGNYDADKLRTNDELIRMIENGENVNGLSADLEIIEVPDGVEWEVEDYDGLEHIVEKHRVFG